MINVNDHSPFREVYFSVSVELILSYHKQCRKLKQNIKHIHVQLDIALGKQ